MALGGPVTQAGGFAQGFLGGLQTGNEIINRNQRTDLYREQLDQARQQQMAAHFDQLREATQAAAGDLRNIPPDQREGYLQFYNQTVDKFVGTYGVDAQLGEAAKQMVANTPYQPETEGGFTLSEGQTRFGPGGEEIANIPAQEDESVARLRRQGFTDQQIDEFLTNKERYTPTTDEFGNRIIFDRFLGEPVGGAKGQPQPLAQTEELPTGNIEQGTGASGFFANIANTLTDAIGAGLAFPQAEEAAQDLKTLQTQTELFMTASVPGRESNQVRDRLRELTVTPNSLLQGDERAKKRLINTRDFVSTELNRLRNLLENPQGLKAEERSNAQANAGQLEAILRAYDQIIQNFDQGGEISDEDEALIQKYLGP